MRELPSEGVMSSLLQEEDAPLVTTRDVLENRKAAFSFAADSEMAFGRSLKRAMRPEPLLLPFLVNLAQSHQSGIRRDTGSNSCVPEGGRNLLEFLNKPAR